MTELLALMAFIGIFCGGLYLAGLVGEQLADDETFFNDEIEKEN